MTTPVTLPGSVGTGPAAQLKQIDLQIKGVNGTIKSLQGQIKASKNAAQKKLLQSRLSDYQKRLSSLAENRVSTQNKVYETSGQYEQLLKGTDRDAYMAINSLFKSYGLESLAGKIYDYVKNGYSADTISVLLQDSSEYKQRFAGNESRKKAGLPVLSAGEYLATESSYRQIMESAGLPSGFYDQPGDFTGWIGKNVSPSEIQTRVDLATQATVLANPNYRKALNMMGVSDSDLTAYFLDQKKALPYLQKSAATAAVGGQALQQGLTFDQAYSEQLALQGISADEAQQGYSQVASELGTMSQLGAIYGEKWGQRESEQAIFEGSAEALRKKGKLLSQERGAFSGGAGTAKSGLAGQGGQR